MCCLATGAERSHVNMDSNMVSYLYVMLCLCANRSTQRSAPPLSSVQPPPQCSATARHAVKASLKPCEVVCFGLLYNNAVWTQSDPEVICKLIRNKSCFRTKQKTAQVWKPLDYQGFFSILFIDCLKMSFNTNYVIINMDFIFKTGDCMHHYRSLAACHAVNTDINRHFCHNYFKTKPAISMNCRQPPHFEKVNSVN